MQLWTYSSHVIAIVLLLINSSSAAFKHPGVFVSQPQLNFVKTKLSAGAQPWTSAKSKISTRFRNTTFPSHEVAVLDCSADSTGCSNLIDDSLGAYAHALQYYYRTQSNPDADAQAAIRILNAWSSTLQSSNGDQARLTLAWSGEVITRAAEIIRYTYSPSTGQASLNVANFAKMLVRVYLPAFDPNSAAVTSSNGNWHLSMIDAIINIGVFTDNQTTFNSAVSQWRQRVPSYIYMSSDGTSPVPPPGGRYNDSAKLRCFWAGAGSPTTSCTVKSGWGYYQGMAQEQCRDISHVTMGLSSIVYAAETARLQGVDLYGEQQARIVAGIEYNAQFDDTYLSTGQWPTQPCGGAPINGDGVGGSMWTLAWEVPYNHYSNRKNISMPYTRNMVNRVRPTNAGNQNAWETLTHAESGSVSLP